VNTDIELANFKAKKSGDLENRLE